MPTYTAITGRRGVPGCFTPKQIRCSLSSLELTCPGTPDLPQKRTANAPAAPRLRVTAKKTGRVLRATVRGASDSRALVAVQARGVELLRRVLLLKARQRGGHTAEDIYVPPEHTYRLAAALAANDVPHAVHVFAHGPHSLGLARGADDVSAWTALAASWIAEYA